MNVDPWEALRESVLNVEPEIDNEVDDGGKEYLPDSIHMALALLPVIKEVCDLGYPLPTVRAKCYGTVQFTWTNQLTLFNVFCYIDGETNGVSLLREGHQVRYIRFTQENQPYKDDFKETLLRYLKDVI